MRVFHNHNNKRVAANNKLDELYKEYCNVEPCSREYFNIVKRVKEHKEYMCKLEREFFTLI